MDTVTGNPDGSSRFRLSHQGVAVAVRPATEPDDPAVVHDTVDDRGGHVAVAENLAPPPELQVRGEHHAPFLVGIRDDLEQEPGPVDVDGQVAQLVDDQQSGAAYRAQFRVEPVLVPRTPQPHHQRRRGEEPHRHAPLDRQHANGDRHVRLAASHVAVEHALLAGDGAGPAHARPHGAVAPHAVALTEGAHDPGPYVGVAAAAAREPGALVLIGALRYPQETGDRAEGQACLPPQSLAELALAPVRDRSRVPPARF